MEQKRRPGHLTAYARHRNISKPAAAEQLRRVGIDYMKNFDFGDADRRIEAARHADRADYAKPIYSPDPNAPDAGNIEEPTSGEKMKDPIFAEIQRRKEHYRAELARLEFEERIANLVKRSDVEIEAFQVGRQVRDGVLNVPPRVSGIIAAAIMSVVRKYIESTIVAQDDRKRILDLLEKEIGQSAIYGLLEKELRQALEVLAIDDSGGTEAA